MESYKIAFPIISVAVLVGLSAGLFANQEVIENGFDISSSISALYDYNLGGQEENGIGALGSAHEHAMFHVVINDSEKNFTDRKFQLNSRYVHLENNKSNIVHKHAKGITWEMFFQTINMSTSVEEGKQCLKIYSERNCGNGSVVLNGDFNASLDQEISQGDNLMVILDTKEWRDTVEEYMREHLPEKYRIYERKGRSV